MSKSGECLFRKETKFKSTIDEAKTWRRALFRTGPRPYFHMQLFSCLFELYVSMPRLALSVHSVLLIHPYENTSDIWFSFLFSFFFVLGVGDWTGRTGFD